MSTHVESFPESIDLYCMMVVVVTRKAMTLASFSLVQCSQGSAPRLQVFVIRLRNSHKSHSCPTTEQHPGEDRETGATKMVRDEDRAMAENTRLQAACGKLR